MTDVQTAHVQQMSPPGGAVAMAELQPPPPPLFEQQRQGAEQQQQSQAVDDFELDFGSHSDAEDQTGMQQGQSATGSALASAKLSSKKKEALSQVPCKFFRSNGCSAGNACPFAHTMPGEGQGKAVCQWFLKGNCRFGHRCALAHVLPGQPMSMDRKNKRAAQQQQQHQPLTVNGQQQQQQQQQQHNATAGLGVRRASAQRSGLARELGHPDMVRMSSIGMPGTDAGPSSHPFGSAAPYLMGREGGDLMFGVPDDLQQPTLMVQGQRRPEWQTRTSSHQNDADLRRSHDIGAFDSMPPTSSANMAGSPAPAQAFGTSPFSHPGSHSVFYSGPSSGYADAERALGKSQSRNDENAALRAAAQRSWQAEGAEGAEDEHAEEFLPSSLSDLLTPAELERRRRSILTSNKASLTAPTTGGTASQSMPARTLNTRLGWTFDSRVEKGQRTSQSPVLEAIGKGISDGVAVDPPVARSSTLTGTRLGASNSSSGFLASRLQGDLSRTRDAWRHAHGQADEPADAYSPGVQAALTHAPGQSLPQGLAAGLSRLHLRSDSGGVGANVRSRFAADVPQQHGSGAASPGVIGGLRSSVDELGPVVPSSIFAHRGMSMHPQLGRSTGHSVSTSFEAGSSSQGNVPAGALHPANGGLSGSPYNRSPALRPEGGIAIPNGSGAVGEKLTAHRTANGGSVPSTGAPFPTTGLPSHKQYAQQHPGMHRLRTAASSGTGIGASPLALPTTGEEVEEAIFELE